MMKWSSGVAQYRQARTSATRPRPISGMRHRRYSMASSRNFCDPARSMSGSTISPIPSMATFTYPSRSRGKPYHPFTSGSSDHTGKRPRAKSSGLSTSIMIISRSVTKRCLPTSGTSRPLHTPPATTTRSNSDAPPPSTLTLTPSAVSVDARHL